MMPDFETALRDLIATYIDQGLANEVEIVEALNEQREEMGERIDARFPAEREEEEDD